MQIRAIRSRRLTGLAVIALVAAPVAMLTLSLGTAAADDVNNETTLRAKVTDANVTLVTLLNDITLTSSCAPGEMLRNSTNDLTIDGQGHTITQNCANSRIIDNTGTGKLTLLNVTLTGGDPSNDGGAVWSASNVTVTDSTITDNSSDDDGGGIYTQGTLTVTNSTFSDNTAADTGGGAYSQGAVSVTGSTFSGNAAGDNEECNCNGGGFATFGGATVTNSTFTDNIIDACDFCDGRGGGFYNAGGATVVTGSTFTGNETFCIGGCDGSGGGFYSAGGNVTVTSSTLSGNSVGCAYDCDAEGGGFFARPFSEASTDAPHAAEAPHATVALPVVSITGSTLSGNEVGCDSGNCDGNGGGFYAENFEIVNVTTSTLNGNQALYGGGALSIGEGAKVTIKNSTITGNSQAEDGAVDVSDQRSDNTLVLVYSDVVGNTVVPAFILNGTGAAAANEPANLSVSGTLTAFGSVVAKPLGTNAINCAVTSTTSEGWNYADDLTCGFTNVAKNDRQATTNDPMLGALANNGGPTKTLLPQTGSPLIDFVPLASCQADDASGITGDQRAISRPQGAGCEIGAVEIEVVTPGDTTVRFTG